MPARLELPRPPLRPAAVSLTALILGVVVVAGGVAPSALSAPSTDKVTICHRTHSVTNPYRLITVSANAAGATGRSGHIGHDEHFGDHPVFDPSVVYPANQKHWADIIPPVRRPNGTWTSGLNWSDAGRALYSGVGELAGLCRRLSAREFYDVQREAWRDDNPGFSPRDELEAQRAILDDLDDQKSLEDEAVKELLGVTSFADLDPEALPTQFTSLPRTPRGPRPPEALFDKRGAQKLGILVWFDSNRDGEFDDDESPAPNIPVSVSQVVDTAPAGFGQSLTIVVATSEDLVTNENGIVFVEDIDAGQWYVSIAPPDGTEVTYDSEGSAVDGEAQVDVPPDSEGFAWVGIAPADATDDGPLLDGDGEGGDDGALAATGPAVTASTLTVMALLTALFGVAVVGLRHTARRRLVDR